MKKKHYSFIMLKCCKWVVISQWIEHVPDIYIIPSHGGVFTKCQQILNCNVVGSTSMA